MCEIRSILIKRFLPLGVISGSWLGIRREDPSDTTACSNADCDEVLVWDNLNGYYIHSAGIGFGINFGTELCGQLNCKYRYRKSFISLASIRIITIYRISLGQVGDFLTFHLNNPILLLASC